jgi:hypothetical protein
MLTRFLKGKSFYDRPLPTFADRPLPIQDEKPHKTLPSQATIRTNELYQATIPTSSVFVGSSGTSVGFIASVAAVCIAFGMGFWTARFKQRGEMHDASNGSERQSLRSGYGSLSVRSSRRGWSTVPFQHSAQENDDDNN